MIQCVAVVRISTNDSILCIMQESIYSEPLKPINYHTVEKGFAY